MTPENFCYWLQGLLEVAQPESMNKQQIQIIRNHLDLVFTKKTPRLHEIWTEPEIKEEHRNMNLEKSKIRKKLCENNLDSSELTVHEVYIASQVPPPGDTKEKFHRTPLNELGRKRNPPLGFNLDKKETGLVAWPSNGEVVDGDGNRVNQNILKFEYGPPRSC